MNFEEIRREIEERRKISSWFDEILQKPIGICETGGLRLESRKLDPREALRRQKIRAVDGRYFRRELGEFMYGKEVHHFWMDGDGCLVLEKQEHINLHSGVRGW